MHPHDTTMPHDLTDEDLARIAYEAAIEGRYRPSWDDLGRKWSHEQEMYRRIARAVRTALMPAVTPLAPGETVTIPDCIIPRDRLSVDANGDRPACYLTAQTEEAETIIALDPGGVRALREACDRYLAAQNEITGVRIG